MLSNEHYVYYPTLKEIYKHCAVSVSFKFVFTTTGIQIDFLNNCSSVTKWMSFNPITANPNFLMDVLEISDGMFMLYDVGSLYLLLL